jgi:hypothetical protein
MPPGITPLTPELTPPEAAGPVSDKTADSEISNEKISENIENTTMPWYNKVKKPLLLGVIAGIAAAVILVIGVLTRKKRDKTEPKTDDRQKKSEQG